MRLFKKILHYTYRPWLENHLSSDRSYSYQDIAITVRQGVFHPGFFFSTKFLLSELSILPLSGHTLLELGCGSGLITIFAARRGALVTASDISSAAIACTRENSAKNQVTPVILQSDLFDRIPPGTFDFIIINPPYYRGQAGSEAEMAWYCGPQLEYFQKLFLQLPEYIHTGTLVMMVVSEDCEIHEINRIAAQHGFDIVLRRSRRFWPERNYIYEIRRQ